MVDVIGRFKNKMAITNTVYSEQYPNNTKTITVDMVNRIPLGTGGDEKFILYIYTSAYSDNTARTAIDPIYIYDIKRGWALGYPVASPISVNGDLTLDVALDEAESGAVTLTVPSGNYSGQSLASYIQTELNATASGSGVKASASNKLSYLNAEMEYADGSFLLKTGSIKSSYNDTYSAGRTTSAKVTGGTLASGIGFYGNYANSYDLATTSSGSLHGPASAAVTVDDAIRFAIMSIQNQIDFGS